MSSRYPKGKPKPSSEAAKARAKAISGGWSRNNEKVSEALGNAYNKLLDLVGKDDKKKKKKKEQGQKKKKASSKAERFVEGWEKNK